MSVFRGLISTLVPHVKVFTLSEVASFHSGVPFYAARKGTRARKEGKKVKVEIKKEAWTPNAKKKHVRVSRKIDESNLALPEDDIYIQKDYKLRTFQFGEAIAAIQETHHPTMYNLPNAFVTASIEINTTTHLKKVKYINPFTHIVQIQNPFDHQEDRSIIAFCKEIDVAEKLQDMGVSFVGSVDSIKGIEKGMLTLPDFQYAICSPKILAELMLIRGMLKKKLPNVKLGTMGVDLLAIAKRLQTGIKYSMMKDPEEQDFGFADFYIGTVNMPTEHLEDNLKQVIKDVLTMRPPQKPQEEDFITRILVWSDPSPEKFKLDTSTLIETPKVEDVESDNDEEEDEPDLGIGKKLTKAEMNAVL